MPNRNLPAPTSKLFRQIRLMLEYKQEAFAELLEISQSKLSKIENGRLRPDIMLMARLREVLSHYEPEMHRHLLSQSNIRDWLIEKPI